MKYDRPRKLLAGYHAHDPDPGVPELLFAGEQWAPSDYLIPDHVHGVWEFYLQLDGESWWESWEDPRRARKYRLLPGHFFAAAPGVKHGLNRPLPAEHHFFFAAVDLDAVFDRHPSLRPLWPTRRCVYVPDGQSLQGPCRQLARELATAMPLRAEGLRAAVDYVVIEASRLLTHGRDRAGGRRRAPAGRPLLPAHPAVQAVRDILDRDFAHPWRLADLGRLAGVSPNHLAQLFRAEVGVAPHQYLIRQRIERAREMLVQTDVPITQVALELGFASSQHFAKTFRRAVGCPAADFRRRARGRRTRRRRKSSAG